MTDRTIHTGTLIHSTHRAADLLPAFMEEFARIDPNGCAGYLDGLEADGYILDVLLPMLAGEDPDHEWFNSDDAAELLQDLIGVLNDHAPAGHYFGAHPSDGSDFGYWQIDNEG